MTRIEESLYHTFSLLIVGCFAFVNLVCPFVTFTRIPRCQELELYRLMDCVAVGHSLLLLAALLREAFRPADRRTPPSNAVWVLFSIGVALSLVQPTLAFLYNDRGVWSVSEVLLDHANAGVAGALAFLLMGAWHLRLKRKGQSEPRS